MTFAPEALAALKPVINFLESRQVRYYVGGSMASSAHGVPRSTVDADVIAGLDSHSASGLAAAIGGDFYASQAAINEAVASRSSFNVIHLPSMFKVDVFVAKRGEYEEGAMTRAEETTASLQGADFTFRVASPEDVVLAKLQWYELGNRISERQWNDIVGVLRVQRSLLDFDYLRRWAPHLGVADLLIQAQSDAAQ